MRKIKWGIIGLGNIANKFASDLQLSKFSELFGVASRDKEKAKTFANQYNSKYFWSNYDELFKNQEIEVIYIATPHNFHYEHTIKALEAGKSVLCEKPLSVNKKQALEMVNLAKQKNLFLMEALWTRFNPIFQKVYDLIHIDKIFQVNYLNADFYFYKPTPTQRMFDINLAGGSLLDIGIYPVFLAYTLLGKPKEIMASSIFHSSVDTQTAIIFKYENAMASLNCGFTAKSDMTAKIYGKNGSIYIKEQWYNAQYLEVTQNEETNKIEIPKKGIGYIYEIEEVERCINENKIESNLWTHQNTIDIVEILDSVRDKINLCYPNE